jgi:hypothetical protein
VGPDHRERPAATGAATPRSGAAGLPAKAAEPIGRPYRKRLIQAAGKKVKTLRVNSEHPTRHKNQRLADLRTKIAQRERELDDARLLLDWELAGDFDGAEPFDDEVISPDARTETLLTRGRFSAYRRGLSNRTKLIVGTAALAILVTILVVVLSGGGASWPASVATVQSQISKACQNPDVKSEPGQVNFACASSTRQVLWVFSLLTSGDNPDFNDTQNGRLGLEPIAPAQGGQIALNLNLHDPYSPYNPVDSLEVAARAINSIVGGATVTGTDGNPVVQPGLESVAANCLRYTGSAALTSHAGFPSLCAQPLSSVAGQAALVSDIYQKWIVGAAPGQAQDAAVLYENANNPGSPQVQAILDRLPGATPSG